MTQKTRLASGLLTAGVLALVFLRSAAAASDARVAGTVRDAKTGVAIEGAAVSVPQLGISTTSGTDGVFQLAVNLASEDPVPTTIEVTAPGYANWTIQNVRLVPGDTLKLDVRIGQSPTLIVVPAPRFEALDWNDVPEEAQLFFGGAAAGQMERRWTIRCRRRP